MVQIGVNEDGLPELATYAEHSGGESCTFAELPTSIGYYGNLAPDVFVSYGVHASYTNTEHLGVGEVTNGAIPVNPQIEDMYGSENCVQWPGKWGDPETSPGAPSTQGTKWTAPDKFFEEGGECTSSGLRPIRLAQKTQKSPLPELGATRAGNVVTVNYHLSENAQPRPKWILVKVSESGGIPIGGNYRVHGNSGQVQIEIPFKGGQMRTLTAGRVGLVVAISCLVLIGCGTGHSDRPAMFALPELNATRAGNVVTVNYHLSENAQPRPKWILVKVSESGGIPIGGNYRVHGNSGQVQIKIPFKGGQLVAMAQAIDREGHSEVVETPVGDPNAQIGLAGQGNGIDVRHQTSEESILSHREDWTVGLGSDSQGRCAQRDSCNGSRVRCNGSATARPPSSSERPRTEPREGPQTAGSSPCSRPFESF